MRYDVIIVGGGAAGIFAALQLGRACPSASVLVMEKSSNYLAKVRISGGGRCNVTHNPMDPNLLTKHYPRGEKELLGPFFQYASSEVMAFFEQEGVALKTESDGRVFPKTNRSESIINALLSGLEETCVKLLPSCGLKDINYQDGVWRLSTNKGEFTSKYTILTTGSNLKIWNRLAQLGHSIVSPVPSLFTFNIPGTDLKDLQGISVPARIQIQPKNKVSLARYLRPYRLHPKDLSAEGPLLITHWGVSGPAVLKLSAWGARLFFDMNYRFNLKINWIPDYQPGSIQDYLHSIKEVEPSKTVFRTQAFELPSRLWQRLASLAGIQPGERWADLSSNKLGLLSEQLTNHQLLVEGKSRFKEEFVTAGGVSKSEVDFRTFESKKFPGLFMAGEILDVDAVTGGFNFQNAWTGAFIAAQTIAEKLNTELQVQPSG